MPEQQDDLARHLGVLRGQRRRDQALLYNRPGQRSRMICMSFLILILLLTGPAFCQDGQKSNYVPEGYTLTWQDEFAGDALDRKKWGFPSYKQRGAAEINSEGCVRVADGMLHLTTLWRDEKVHASYVYTRGRFTQRYGYFECRLRFHKHQGHHGAFWVQTPTFKGQVDKPGESGTEMDIIEWFGGGRRRGWAGMNIYYWGKHPDGRIDKVRSPSIPDFPKMGGPVERDPDSPMADLSDGFRTYGLLWTKTECVFFCDGVEIMRDTEAISHIPQYVVLSLLCADWERPRLDTDKLPDGMQVDYVRVYAAQDASASAK
jgi:beta-glucanase (GH16 family)